MVHASNLGFPRIGFQRELKKGLEKYWADELSQQELCEIAHTLRVKNWQLQNGARVMRNRSYAPRKELAAPKRFGDRSAALQ